MEANSGIMKKLFSSEGRLNRWPYFLRMVGIWLVAIILSVLYTIISLIINIIFAHISQTIGYIIIFILMLIFFIIYFVLFVCSIFQSIKRLHDLNKSGWLLLIRLVNIIPIIGWIIAFVFEVYLFLADGTQGPNQYGQDPLRRQSYYYPPQGGPMGPM